MATKVNGAVIEFAGYEYGVEVDGMVFPRDDYTDALVMHRGTPGSKMKFRALYVTEWWEATEPNNEEAENNEA